MSEGKPLGFWSAERGVEYAHLVPGRRYRVARAFADFDRRSHEVGEEWTYLGTSFLPHDDGRSLFVSYDGEHEWHIRMQDREGEQADILANLAEFVVPIDD